MRTSTQENLVAQDHLLDSLGAGVDRLHQQAQVMGDETRVQNRLLDDMDTDVEAAAGGLRAEAAHATVIAQLYDVQWRLCNL